jgi:hypothetical protein
MPGTSRMPISLRESINHVKRRRPANLAAVINVDLYVGWTRDDAPFRIGGNLEVIFAHLNAG